MKRTVPLLLVIFLVCAMTCPALATDPADTSPPARTAALYPTEVVETGEGDCRRLEKVYLLTAADNPANIPTDDFDREGYHYTLLDVTRQDYTESETKEHTEAVTLDSDTKDMNKIMPQLAATKEVTTEDGFTGILTLDTASVQVEASGYGSSSRTVSAFRNYPNLSDTDAALIPKTITDSGRTLTLADIQWQEAGGFYNASATYTGTATSRYATGYTISANYTGEVAKTIDGEMIYTAIFSGTPLHADASQESPPSDSTEDRQQPVSTEPIPTEPVNPDGGNLKWLLVIPAAAVAAGLVFGGKYIYKAIKSKKEWRNYTK